MMCWQWSRKGNRGEHELIWRKSSFSLSLAVHSCFLQLSPTHGTVNPPTAMLNAIERYYQIYELSIAVEETWWWPNYGCAILYRCCSESFCFHMLVEEVLTFKLSTMQKYSNISKCIYFLLLKQADRLFSNILRIGLIARFIIIT